MKKKDAVYDVGVIVGRFHVPVLHEGHMELFKEVLSKHDKVIIFLGLSPIMCSYENPLDFEARKQSILESFPKHQVNILYIKDTKEDEVWSRNLDSQIEAIKGPHQTVMLYGGRDSFIDHYMGKYDTTEMVQDTYPNVSGSEIRRKLSNAVKSSADWRAGVIWATRQHHWNAIPTVDVAIWDPSKKRVLLAKKEDEKLYRFVGGFVDAGENWENAARREVGEETCLETDSLNYLGSFVIDDWRYRNEKVKITTTLFKSQYIFGKPEPRDDIAELKWFPVSAIKPTDVEEEHIPLLRAFMKSVT